MEFCIAHGQCSIQPKTKQSLVKICTFLELLFCTVPIFPSILPCKFHSPKHSQIPIPVSSVQGEHCGLPRSPLLCYSLENASRQKPIVIISFTLFISFLSSVTVLTVLQCLKTVVSDILSNFLIVYG